MEWFSRVGDSTGYSIVNAESMKAAVELAKTNPMITSVLVYELARM